MITAGGDRDFFRFRGALFEHRLVNVIAILLFLQHGNVFLRDDVGRDVLDGDAIQLWIDCDQVDYAWLVHVDVAKVAVGFVADHIRQSRDQRPDVAHHASPAFAFKAFGDESHRVSRIGEAFQLQVKSGVAFAIGFLLTEIDCLLLLIFVFVKERVEKREVAKFRK